MSDYGIYGLFVAVSLSGDMPDRPRLLRACYCEHLPHRCLAECVRMYTGSKPKYSAAYRYCPIERERRAAGDISDRGAATGRGRHTEIF